MFTLGLSGNHPSVLAWVHRGLVGSTKQKPSSLGLCIPSSGWEAWAPWTKAFLIGVSSALTAYNKDLPHRLSSAVLYKVLPTQKQLSTDGHSKWFHVKFSAQPLIILVPIKALPRPIKNFWLEMTYPIAKANNTLESGRRIHLTWLQKRAALLTSLWQTML